MKMHQSTNSSMSVMMNGIKPPTTDVIKTPIPSSTTSSKLIIFVLRIKKFDYFIQKNSNRKLLEIERRKMIVQL
jgi:hypothetical protein